MKNLDYRELSQSHLTFKNRGGSVEHYYHFILGFLVPLTLTQIDQKKAATQLIRSCAIMDKHIKSLNFENIKILDKSKHFELLDYARPNINYDQQFGFDGIDFYNYELFKKCSDFLSQKLKNEIDAYSKQFKESAPFKNKKRIILIERKAADAYYASERSEKKKAGIEKRSISNFNELKEAIVLKYPNTLAVYLEDKSLAYQIALFQYADAIIAQHGAAFANLIWCRRNTRVIEILPKIKQKTKGKFFRKLAKCMKLKYRVVSQQTNHSDVDVNKVLKHLESSSLKDLFI